MKVAPFSNNVYKSQNNSNTGLGFGHGHSAKNSSYSPKEKALISATTAIGVMASLAMLAKNAKYSLKPSKMFSNIKKSYLAKVEYHDKEVITIGAGSCLGGLAGGYMIDKNPTNRKAKRREALMQIGNISIPILTVEGFAKIGANFGKVAKGLAATAGIFVGIYLANYIMNKASNFIFKDNSGERGVKATDFTAHLDDAVVAANCISSSDFVHGIARIVPLALMFAGNEVGNKEG
jgi:hypothetical protein